MGNCFSSPTREDPNHLATFHHPSGNGNGNGTHGPPPNGAHYPPMAGHRMLAQLNVYKDDPLNRKMSFGQPSMYLVNANHATATISSQGSRSGGGANGTVRVVAMYPYESRVKEDISFQKDDVMILLDDSNSDWWLVKHAKNGTGYVPRNFVAKKDTLESEEWYAGLISRTMAEKIVSAPNLPRGTYLVRRREQENEFALTVNDSENSRAHGINVKHYKIRPMDAGFYITTKKVFSTIKDLVNFYSEMSAGLCCKLTYAAPRMAPLRTDLSSDTKTNWEIPRTELTLIEKLGSGNFGDVFYGKWKDGTEVAIKTMKKGTMAPDAFLREAHIMKQCQHPKLVRLYAVCTREEPFYIVTEFMKNGSLYDFLRKPENTLAPGALVDMCAQIALGMSFLEERKLVHRDLAARNVLVGERISGVPEVKVADFGLARTLMEEDIYEAQLGTKFPIKWTAIEAAIYGNFTVKSDVWSYGVLLYEIFTRSSPYPGMTNKQVIEEVERGYRMPRPPEIAEPVYAEMLKCWDSTPERRPTFEYLHHFFDDYYVSSQPSYVPSSVDEMGYLYRR